MTVAGSSDSCTCQTVSDEYSDHRFECPVYVAGKAARIARTAGTKRQQTSKSRVYVSQGFLYGDGAVRNATVAEQTLGDEIVRLTRELEVQNGVVDMAYIPHRHLVEQRDRADSEFKNFHRLLCERFGYGHDERDWRRDQLSLIEHIANRPAPETFVQPDVRALLMLAYDWLRDGAPEELKHGIVRAICPTGTLTEADFAWARAALKANSEEPS